MKKNYETPECEDEPGFYVAPMVYTQLLNVEVVIAGKGIDILPFLSEKQKNKIIASLQYEE